MQIQSSSASLSYQHLAANRSPHTQGKTQASDSSENVAKDTKELTPEEQKQVQDLKARDREVRAHEQAHKSAAGSLASGGPTYTYETGPDGKKYAVGGEVQIDTSSVKGNPEASIRKAKQIQRAASAPAHPSSQDRLVAAQAAAMEQEARAEKRAMKVEEAKENDAPKSDPFKIEATDDQPSQKSAISAETENNIHRLQETFTATQQAVEQTQQLNLIV